MKRTHFTLTLAFCGVATASTAAYAAKTYYIDEGVTFDGTAGCAAIANVNTITASLKTALDGDSWSGSRYVDSSAWPQDFKESCSTTYAPDGYDYLYADSKSLSVYAGHGSAHTLYFGQAHSSECTVDLSAESRLGTMSGAGSAFGMWLECEVLQSSELGTNMYQWERQQVGWQNTINIGDDEPRDFYNNTHTYTNADAWLNTMGTQYYGGRDAIVSTFDPSSLNNCWSVYNSAKLKDNVYTSPLTGGPSCGAGQSLYYYCFEHYEAP